MCSVFWASALLFYIQYLCHIHTHTHALMKWTNEETNSENCTQVTIYRFCLQGTSIEHVSFCIVCFFWVIMLKISAVSLDFQVCVFLSLFFATKTCFFPSNSIKGKQLVGFDAALHKYRTPTNRCVSAGNHQLQKNRLKGWNVKRRHNNNTTKDKHNANSK